MNKLQMLDLLHSLFESTSGCVVLPILAKGIDLAVRTDVETENDRTFFIEIKELKPKNE